MKLKYFSGTLMAVCIFCVGNLHARPLLRDAEIPPCQGQWVAESTFYIEGADLASRIATQSEAARLRLAQLNAEDGKSRFIAREAEAFTIYECN